MARHLCSQASVRSTTQRRALRRLRPRLSSFSSPIRRMCVIYPASSAASSPVGLSYPLSRQRCCSTSSGSGRWSRWLPRGACSHAGLPRRAPLPRDRRRPRPRYFSLCRPFLGRWDWDRFFPPPNRDLLVHPSADCHVQSRPPSSSHSETSSFQMRWKRPFFTHSWNQ